jgi:hypothetical protein
MFLALFLNSEIEKVVIGIGSLHKRRNPLEFAKAQERKVAAAHEHARMELSAHL